MLWFLLLAALVAVLAYYALIKPMRYWSDRGIEQGRPWPIVGHNLTSILRTQPMADLVVEVYNQAPNKRFSGMYQFTTPTLIIRDPELIKLVGVKDFDYFTDHRSFMPEEAEPLWGKNLFALKGQRWRDMRATLSPSFTGSKMRQMFVLMSDGAQQFVQYFVDESNRAQSVITLEFKDAFTRFANDIIASTAFGVRVDSLKKRDNEFYRMGLDATNFSSLSKNLIFFGYLLFPRVMQFFGFHMFSNAVRDFFQNLVKDTISTRIQRKIVRPDMINLLMEARKSGYIKADEPDDEDAGYATVQESDSKSNSVESSVQCNKITDQDITAQALIFFFAGFDSVSGLMCFLAYELAVNPDIQLRVLDEVDEAFERHDGKLTYDVVVKMEYLDMVISETLRKWPNAIASDRICNRQYTIPAADKDEEPLVLEKNTVIWIPTYGIHRDPKYYPNPERFDPERFNEENRKQIDPYVYLPFGVGPRNCIGSRFALLETKALFCHLLSKFEIVPVAKTQIPIKLSKKNFNLTAENGFWMGLQKRIGKVDAAKE